MSAKRKPFARRELLEMRACPTRYEKVGTPMADAVLGKRTSLREQFAGYIGDVFADQPADEVDWTDTDPDDEAEVMTESQFRTALEDIDNERAQLQVDLDEATLSREPEQGEVPASPGGTDPDEDGGGGEPPTLSDRGAEPAAAQPD